MNNDIKEIEQKAESWIKGELKEHWGRILLIGLATVILVTGYADLRDDIKHFFQKDNKTIVQTTPAPINLNANGQQIDRKPDIYVNVNPVLGEKSVATVIPKTENATPSASITDNQPKFFLKYNGVRYDYVPYTTEQANFDPKSWQFTYTRNTTMDINVEVPQPRYSIGVGKSLKGGVAVTGDYRLGQTPFQVWGYASDKDQAIGLKFTQYATPSKKGGEKK